MANKIKLLDKDIINPRMYDPHLRPDWRWERVLELTSRQPSPGRCTRFDDEYIARARSFMLRWKKGENEREKLRSEHQGMFYAHQIWDKINQSPEVQFIVEACLLANKTYEAIAKEVFTTPAAIEWYEAIFFNIKPRIQSHGWIFAHVLLPASDRYYEQQNADDDDDDTPVFRTPVVVRPHLDMTLKFFSYFGGPIVNDYMLTGFKRGMKVDTQDELGGWLDENFMVAIQKRSAQSAHVFEINKYNVMELFATHSRIMEIQKSSESQEERHSTIERHIHSMLGEIPWTVGADAREIFEGTAIGKYDEMSAELNEEELMLIGAGQKLEGLEEMPGLDQQFMRASGKEVEKDEDPKS
jgi:hypothetical protein